MCPQVLLQNMGRNLGQSLTEFTLRIIEPTENSRPDRTGFNTRRRFILHDAVITPSALVRIVRLRVDESHAVGARLNTVGTANTLFGIDQVHSLRRLKRSMDRTDLHAGGVDTLVTKLGDKVSPCNIISGDFWEFRSSVAGFWDEIDLDVAILEVDIPFDPRAGETIRNIILGSAGTQAFAGPDTLFCIHQKPKQYGLGGCSGSGIFNSWFHFRGV